jgi:hypothetical protein
VRGIKLSAFFISVLLGCSDTDGPTYHPLDELLAAPQSVVVGGKKLELSTLMWRDFQPSSPPDGKPLIAVFFVSVVDSSAYPSDTVMASAWVILGRDVWAAALTDEEAGDLKAPYRDVRVARGGPKFGPDVVVEAVVLLAGPGGREQLLRAPDQYIGRTE